MDEVLDRLLQVSSDGLSYVGHISVAKKAGSQGTFKPKVEELLTSYGNMHVHSNACHTST